MTAVRVHRDGYDWVAECAEHNDNYWCFDWTSAMEAAWGHIAMWHMSTPLGNDDAEEIR